MGGDGNLVTPSSAKLLNRHCKLSQDEAFPRKGASVMVQLYDSVRLFLCTTLYPHRQVVVPILVSICLSVKVRTDVIGASHVFFQALQQPSIYTVKSVLSLTIVFIFKRAPMVPHKKI